MFIIKPKGQYQVIAYLVYLQEIDLQEIKLTPSHVQPVVFRKHINPIYFFSPPPPPPNNKTGALLSTFTLGLAEVKLDKFIHVVGSCRSSEGFSGADYLHDSISFCLSSFSLSMLRELSCFVKCPLKMENHPKLWINTIHLLQCPKHSGAFIVATIS